MSLIIEQLPWFYRFIIRYLKRLHLEKMAYKCKHSQSPNALVTVKEGL
ncbi:MAG: hypothetical protein ACJASB_002711 [Shewanella psychromarinicola]|jgi:hypothetical protein